MYASVWGSALDGLQPHLVKVEVDVGRGLPAFEIVGQPNRIVRESRDRIRSAFRNCGLQFPPTRITVNLAPADFPKTGSSLDLPIAVAILIATGQLCPGDYGDYLFWGELSLDGCLQPCRGVLTAALLAQKESQRFVFPKAELEIIQRVQGLKFAGFAGLQELVLAFKREAIHWETASTPLDTTNYFPEDPWSSLAISGGLVAKRCLAIAAVGRHNIALIGPPGVGKTLLIQALANILPPLSREEELEVAQIYSAVGLSVDSVLKGRPPVRSPHHTLTRAGLLGGGLPPKPGEITLAHKGLLFLDELPEFSRPVLTALREPLENKTVSLPRGNKCYTFPADFQLAAAFNPCPCGYNGYQPEKCTCTERQISAYLRPITGAFADRIHLRLSIPRPLWEEPKPTSVSEFPVKIGLARREILQRDSANLETRIHSKAKGFLRRLIHGQKASARAYYHLISVASTIAALEGSEAITREHLSEAWQYRWESGKYLDGGGEEIAFS